MIASGKRSCRASANYLLILNALKNSEFNSDYALVKFLSREYKLPTSSLKYAIKRLRATKLIQGIALTPVGESLLVKDYYGDIHG